MKLKLEKFVQILCSIIVSVLIFIGLAFFIFIGMIALCLKCIPFALCTFLFVGLIICLFIYAIYDFVHSLQ